MKDTVSSPSVTACSSPMNDEEEYRAYLLSRHASNKTNYYLASLKELEQIHRTYDHKPRLLLHVCCGVCAAWPLEFLHEHFDITILYSNSNIWPEQEYTRRRDELKRLLQEAWQTETALVELPYDHETYMKELEPRKDDPEGWKRCFHCYAMRIEDAYRYAQEHGYDYVTTVMTISRQKDSQKLNEIGLALQEKYPGIKYFCSDFKKKGGQQRRDELVKLYNLYSQDYCGCEYSQRSRNTKENT